MTEKSIRFRALSLLIMALAVGPAFGHVSAPIALVAGSGVAGLKDGARAEAQFNSPTALALSYPGPVLWVNDENNHQIRLVRLGKTTEVHTLKLGKEAREKLEGILEIVPLPGDGRLAVLCAGGKRIVEIGDDLSKTARVLYSGSALEQLNYVKDWDLFLALEQKSGKILRAPGKKSGTLRFSSALDRASFTALAADGDTLVAFQQGPPSKLFFLKPADSGLTVTSETSVADPFPGHQPLRLAYAVFDDGVTRIYLWEPGGKGLFRAENGTLLRQEIHNAQGEPLNIGGPRSPFNSLTGLVVDQNQRAIYVSDARDNRLLKIKDLDYSQLAFGFGSRRMQNDFAYPQAKPQDVHRILFYGSSYSYYTEVIGLGKFDNVNKKLEYYLNLKSMAHSTPYGFEVLFDGLPLTGVEDVFSHAMGRVGLRKDYQADDYLITLMPSDIFYCTEAYQYRPLEAGNGLPMDRFDPEFALDVSHPAKRFKGRAAEIYNEISSHASYYAPDIVLDSAGRITFDPFKSDLYRLYGDNRFTHLMEACTNGMLQAFSAKIQEISPGARLFVQLVPQRNFLGFQETVPENRFFRMDTVPNFSWHSFQALNQDPNVFFINVDDLLKIESVSYFPIFLNQDHLYHGTDIVGYLTAELLWPYVEEKH